MTNSEAVPTRNITFRVAVDLADEYRRAVKADHPEMDVSKALRLHMRETVAAASDTERDAA